MKHLLILLLFIGCSREGSYYFADYTTPVCYKVEGFFTSNTPVFYGEKTEVIKFCNDKILSLICDKK